MRHAVFCQVAVLFIQHKVGKFDRLERKFTPVFFGILLRMRVLDGKAVGRGGIEGRALDGAQDGGKNRILASRRGIGAHTVLHADAIVLQIVNAAAGALVGVGHGTAVFKAPFA